MRFALQIIALAMMLVEAPGTLFAQEQSKLPMMMDTTSKDFDWDPEEDFQHPARTFEKDPWTATAKALSKKKPSNVDVNRVRPFRAFNGLDPTIIKALGLTVAILSKPEGYIATTEEPDDIDVVSIRYQSLVPFEIRHTPYVWALVVETPTDVDIHHLAGFLGMSLKKYSAKFVVVENPKVAGYEYQLIGDKLPPYLDDAIVFRSGDSFILAGSSIMGHIPFPVSHHWDANKKWLRRYLPKE